MGIHILRDIEKEAACMYCSTSDFAFGPVCSETWHDGNYDPEQILEVFMHWHGTDGIRLLAPDRMESRWEEFVERFRDDRRAFELIIWDRRELEQLRVCTDLRECGECGEIVDQDVVVDDVCSACRNDA